MEFHQTQPCQPNVFFRGTPETAITNEIPRISKSGFQVNIRLKSPIFICV